jgi:hypothetical protein
MPTVCLFVLQIRAVEVFPASGDDQVVCLPPPHFSGTVLRSAAFDQLYCICHLCNCLCSCFCWRFQTVAMFYSTAFANIGNIVYTVILLFWGFVQTMLVGSVFASLHIVETLRVSDYGAVQVIEIAVLLQPSLKGMMGWPVRAEYVFGWLGLLITVSGIINKALDIDVIRERVRLELTTNSQAGG